VEILQQFHRDNVDNHTSLDLVARRKKIVQSACSALSRSYFVWYRIPNIEFMGEMAEDYGGPRREFFR